jgi:hypothetical protein
LEYHMTPAEEYRALANRLQALSEATPAPPSSSIPNIATGQMPASGPVSTPDPAKSRAMQQLRGRCESVIKRLAGATQGFEQEIIGMIEVQVADDPDDDDLYSYARLARIVVDYNQWDDAPDNVLTWSLAHEVGHIVMDHRKPQSPQHSQQQELAADAYATRLCLSLGITRAPAFKWANDKRDRLRKQQDIGTLHKNKLDQMNDPANADFYRDQASHPTYQQRFDRAGEQGFELSKADTDQLDRFLAHMSNTA